MAGTSASGRRALSNQSHVLNGTFRADRHGGHETPEAPQGIPDPPKSLEGDAKDEWDRMVGRLQLCGTLSKVDDQVIYQFSRLFAETEELVLERSEAKATLKIVEDNLSGIDKSDFVAVLQEIGKLRHDIKSYGTCIRQNRMAIRQFLVEMGQTPAARSRVKLPATKPKSKVEQFKERLQ